MYLRIRTIPGYQENDIRCRLSEGYVSRLFKLSFYHNRPILKTATNRENGLITWLPYYISGYIGPWYEPYPAGSPAR